MLEYLGSRRLLDDPSLCVLFFENTGVDGQMLKTLRISFELHLARKTFESMRCVRHAFENQGLQGGKFVEDVEELADAEMLLHLIFSMELYVNQVEFEEPAPEVFSKACHSFVLQHLL